MTARTKQTRDFKTSYVLILEDLIAYRKEKPSVCCQHSGICVPHGKKNNWIDDTEGNSVE